MKYKEFVRFQAPVEDLGSTQSENNTVGALDMGGASTQITFYTPDKADIPSDYRKDMELYGSNYTVYTHSYLCFGINEAIRQYQAILVKVGNSDLKSHISA